MTKKTLDLNEPRPADEQDVIDFEDALDAKQLWILSRIESDAYQEGYDKGYDQGMEDGYNEARYGEQFPPSLNTPR